MAVFSRILSLSALAASSAYLVSAGASGSGTTTRYWDCCKPSCAWNDKADVSSPVSVCDIDDNVLSDGADATSGCDSGTAYMCSDQSPWAVNSTMAYGFAAVSISGGSESSWCCACYELTFTSTAIAGKKMIVQATNTGGDLSSNQFDLAIPGGGVGIYNGCTDEWGAPSSGWGAQYGGISSNTCSTFPTALQSGCEWRFDWFEGADNPTVDFVQVTCPAALTAKTGCVRDGETPTGSSSASTMAEAATSAAASSVAASSDATSAAVSSAADANTYVATSSSAVAESAAATVESSSYVAPSFSVAAATSSYVAPISTSATAVASPSSTYYYDDEGECEL
ncbi:MAG: hypothetical protein M1834_006938 [Cirrosporium novae-zelandiae]|nr:MAG: hypothetical protein M1834_006938 [Cirrosporium novae-zelandiae]